MKDESTTTSGKTDANWRQKNAVMQGYELSISKTYITSDGSFLVALSRDDISGVFDDDTYIPRISPAKNTLSLKYETKQNDAYYATKCNKMMPLCMCVCVFINACMSV